MTKFENSTWMLAAIATCCVVLDLMSPVAAWCQRAEGVVLGNVKDAQGEAVVGAQVKVSNQNTNVVNTFSTTKSGDYVVPGLSPGVYTVTVVAPGFKQSSSTGLVLQVNQTLRQNFVLQLGKTQQQVVVHAEGQMLQTDNSTIGQTLSAQDIENLPLSGHNFTQLLDTGAGATTMEGGIEATGFVLKPDNSSFSSTSIDGARPGSISYMIDGVYDVDQNFGYASNIPNTFAISDMKTQNGMYGAEFGQGSAQVNVALKSGTNDWHGNLYDYVQNSFFQPNSPEIVALNKINHTNNNPNPPFTYNEFGGTIGGPVIFPRLYNGKNKTFWFFSYDGGRIDQSSQALGLFVPTARERTGDFSDWPYPIYDPATTGSVAPTPSNPAGRRPFPNNVIPPGRFSPISKNMMAYFLKPNTTCANILDCVNFLGFVQNTTVDNTESYRIDQNFGEKDRFTITGVHTDLDNNNPALQPATGGVSYLFTDLAGIQWQHTFSTHSLNELDIGYNRQDFHTGVDTALGPNLSQQLGLSNVPNIPAFFDTPVVSLTDSYSGFGSGNNGYTQYDDTYEVSDDMTLIRGRNTYTFGEDIRRIGVFDNDGFTAMGQLNFNGEYTSSSPAEAQTGAPTAQGGNPFADLLLGYPSSVSGPPPLGSDDFHVWGNNINLFFQDDYRATSNLTINAGLRYEIPPTFHSRSNSGFTINPADGGSLVWASRKFVQQTAVAGTNPNYLQCCAVNTLAPYDKLDFAPRIGFAWRPPSTEKVVIRGGYGIFYDTYARYYDLTQFDTDGLYVEAANPAQSLTPTGLESSSPLALNTLWRPPIKSTAAFSTPSYEFPYNQVNWPYNHNPFNQQWTLDAQYNIRPTTLLDVAYVGAHGERQETQLLIGAATNPRVANDPCNFLQDASQATGKNASCASDPNFQPIDTRVPWKNLPSYLYANANLLSSVYDGLLVQVQQRYNDGIDFHLNYTWSKTLDESSVINNAIGTSAFIQNPHNIPGDFGPASYNQTNRFVGLFTWQLPVGHGMKYDAHWANWIVGNWAASGIYTAASGFPFSIYSFGGGPAQDGTNFNERIRMNVNPGHNGGYHRNYQEWFNRADYAPALPGRYGNTMRNLLVSPYQMNMDMEFNKLFPIHNQTNVKYTLDVFNLGSDWHSTPPIPANHFTNNNFGWLYPDNGAGSANLTELRVIQMAMIFSF